jgi:hypothetical protein
VLRRGRLTDFDPRSIFFFWTCQSPTNQFAICRRDAGAGSAGLGRTLWRIRANLCFRLTKG